MKLDIRTHFSNYSMHVRQISAITNQISVIYCIFRSIKSLMTTRLTALSVTNTISITQNMASTTNCILDLSLSWKIEMQNQKTKKYISNIAICSTSKRHTHITFPLYREHLMLKPRSQNEQ